MKMKPSTIVMILALVSASCLSGAVLFEGQTKWAHRLYDDLVLDNKNHYLPCENLPTAVEVMEILDEHQAAIEKIEQVNPGNVGVDIDLATCPGKADLLIWYASHNDREAIEQMLMADTFFGVPYRLQNR
jgi:hypothetical protein